jgi:hypothetical protein
MAVMGGSSAAEVDAPLERVRALVQDVERGDLKSAVGRWELEDWSTRVSSTSGWLRNLAVRRKATCSPA